MPLRILVTGANGYLGSQLLAGFAKQQPDWQLHALVRQGATTGRLAQANRIPEVHRFDHDLGNVSELVNQIQPDVVIHTACSYGRKHEKPVDVLQANVMFGAVLLDGLIAVGRAVTFVNTGSALEPSVSLYALTKSQFTQYGCMLAGQSNGLQFINISLQHMYGAGDDDTKFPTRIVRMLLSGQGEIELTEGLQRRDFIHIDDVLTAYSRCIESRQQLGKCETIEVGSGQAPSIRDFVELAKALTGSSAELKFGAVPMRAEEPALCVADIKRLSSLGWVASHTLKSGLTQMIEQEKTQ